MDVDSYQVDELQQNTKKDIEAFFEKKTITPESVSYFMFKIRLLLEINNQKGRYKILNHYCNWLLHKNLNQGISPEIIKEISSLFTKKITKNDFVIQLNEILSIKKLIVELKEMLYINIGFKHQYTFENDQFWVNFLIIFLKEIKLKPLLLIKNRLISSEEIKDIDFDFSIFGIQLTDNNDNIVVEILSKEFLSEDKRIYIEFAIFKEITSTKARLDEK